MFRITIMALLSLYFKSLDQRKKFGSESSDMMSRGTVEQWLYKPLNPSKTPQCMPSVSSAGLRYDFCLFLKTILHKQPIKG